MTETTSGTTQGSARGRGLRGLGIERVYTKPGVHPYDEVNWERRDVVMTNWRDGSINFEQRGVEFPDFWSVNAANIVTTKYFRGAVGTEQREWSLKQLIDRVVLTYVKAGQVNGYFATVDDATVFEHELTYALLHQIFSFNSPVWFNVGTSSSQQVSACFILAVDDKMDSHPRLVQGRGADLQGRLGLRRQPVADPLVEGAAVVRRHGFGSGVVHARRRRLRRHHQVRRRDAARGEDGRSSTSTTPTSRSSSRPRRARKTRSGCCATPVTTWTSAAATCRACSTRTPTTRCASTRSSCARTRTAARSV